MSDIGATLPQGRPARIRLDNDALVKRGLMIVIAAYLFAALALPLYAMLSKSFTTYSFDLTRYEFQVSDESGTNWSEPVTAKALNDKLSAVPPADLDTISDGRLPATSFFPDFSFRSPVKYRIRGTVENAPYLVGLDPFNSIEW